MLILLCLRTVKEPVKTSQQVGWPQGTWNDFALPTLVVAWILLSTENSWNCAHCELDLKSVHIKTTTGEMVRTTCQAALLFQGMFHGTYYSNRCGLWLQRRVAILEFTDPIHSIREWNSEDWFMLMRKRYFLFYFYE